MVRWLPIEEPSGAVVGDTVVSVVASDVDVSSLVVVSEVLLFELLSVKIPTKLSCPSTLKFLALYTALQHHSTSECNKYYTSIFTMFLKLR